MPSIKKVGSKVQFEIEKFDGGLNTKDSPSRVGVFESPDCKNVIFDDQGSVTTREGTSYFNTSTAEPGSNVIDGLTEFNGTMVAWAGGSMFRVSGTTLVTIGSSQGQFSSGVKVAYANYQDTLFMSDGTNGPYRYTGDGFYQMGLATPTAATASSDTSGGGDVAADTYYYAVTFVNTAAVEGSIGTASDGTTLSASAAVDVSEIQTGAASEGVAQRFVYRATSATGPWLFVKTLTNNTATSFSDNVGVGAEGAEPPDDATKPTAFNTIKLHKERLFFDDAENTSDVRYTEFQNPYVSKALSFEPLDQGDGSSLKAIAVQDDLVTMFKEESVWLFALNDSSDDTTWQLVKSPANMGIMGARAYVEVDNGIMFLGQKSGERTGFHFLSGISIAEAGNNGLRTRSISERIELNVLTWSSDAAANTAMYSCDNRVYIAAPTNAASTVNDAIWWFDLNRLGDEGQPGSWSLWTGDVGITDFTTHSNALYGGSSLADGYVLQLNNGTYTDASGAGIDSYFWTRELGGESSIESWIKDFRFINLWYELLGAWNMSLRWRVDGDSGTGDSEEIDLTPGGAVWNSFSWGTGTWGGGIVDRETQHNLGRKPARRLQARFDNQYNASDTTANAGQAFKVHSMKTLMNLRRQR